MQEEIEVLKRNDGLTGLANLKLLDARVTEEIQRWERYRRPLALVLMAGLRERLNLVKVPDVVQGTAVSLMLAGLLSLTFMGFAGLGAGE